MVTLSPCVSLLWRAFERRAVEEDEKLCVFRKLPKAVAGRHRRKRAPWVRSRPLLHLLLPCLARSAGGSEEEVTICCSIVPPRPISSRKAKRVVVSSCPRPPTATVALIISLSLSADLCPGYLDLAFDLAGVTAMLASR